MRMARVTRRSAWLEAHPFTLKLDPFPPLKMTLSEFEGEDVLPAWAGTQQRQGGYTSISSRKSSKGSFRVRIERLDDNDANPRPPSPEQVAAYAHLKDHQAAISADIFARLLKYYAALRKTWLKQDANLDLPEIGSAAAMKRNVGFGTLHVMGIAKGGFAYLGLELGCTWDEEHGAGVLLHRSRIVEIGQADTSFDDHAATSDGGKRLK
jgi:hypothetical protein